MFMSSLLQFIWKVCNNSFLVFVNVRKKNFYDLILRLNCTFVYIIPQEKFMNSEFMTFLCVKLSSFILGRKRKKKTNIFFYQCSKSICPLSRFSFLHCVPLNFQKLSEQLLQKEVIKNKGHCLDMNNNICV